MYRGQQFVVAPMVVGQLRHGEVARPLRGRAARHEVKSGASGPDRTAERSWAAGRSLVPTERPGGMHCGAGETAHCDCHSARTGCEQTVRDILTFLGM